MERTNASQKSSGLFCEGCKHEFLPGELMLMAYEDGETEMMTSFCCDCLAYELAVETAVPEDFVFEEASNMKKERRIKLVGQQTVGSWHFSNDVVFSMDEEIADILSEAKAETGNYFNVVRLDVRHEISKYIENIKIVYHRHNGRVQRFSVYVPKPLYRKLAEAYRTKTLLDIIPF